jgi:hypothetical protein
MFHSVFVDTCSLMLCGLEHLGITECYGVIQCVRKVAVHLQKALEVMSTTVYTGLKPFNP